MKLGNTIDLLCDRFKLDRDNQEARAIFKDKLNLIYKEIGNNSNVNWKHLERTGEIVTVPNYTTGTCDITNGSRTVNFTGDVTGMAGRYFKAEGSKNWYRINYIASSGQAILQTPIQESTASGVTFTIWKRYYFLPSEVRKVIEFGSWILNGELVETTRQKLNAKTTDVSLVAQPEEFLMVGADNFASDYTTGTIALVKDSNVATGTSTAWLGNVEPGDILTVGEAKYRVKRVETDTRMILMNYATQDADTTYTIQKDSNIGFQLWYNPDSTYVLPYTYQKRVYDLVNEDYDLFELPDEFELAILDGAEAERFNDLDDNKYQMKIQVYAARVSDLKANRFVSQPRLRSMPPRILSRGRYINGF